jgi:glycosyltransferase involved in cell wall biosynthesis
MQKKVALLHRYPEGSIKETNAAFPYLKKQGIDVLTFKSFDRLSRIKKFWKSLFWVFYAPLLVAGKGYDVIYCDDSYPFYPALVKLSSPRSKVVIRIGDMHLMYYYKGLAYKVLHFFERLSWFVADEIVVISEAMADYFEDEIGRRPKVVLDPVDTKSFSVNGVFNMGTVMFHGVLTKNKNVDVLLEAAELLPDIDFEVIGDGPDLKRLMKKAPSNVFFRGWVPFKDIPRYVASCSIGVALRTNNPGNEYVVTSPFLQYGVMGKPCLVTRRKVFGDYIWQFSGADELALNIMVLMHNAEEVGENLKAHVIKNHDAEKIAGEIWQILTHQS